VPLKQLVEFERLSDIGPGKSTAVTFSLDPYVSLSLTAANGSKVVYPVRRLYTDDYYCELHNNRPNFALFLLFSGAVLHIVPAQSDFQ